MKAMRPTTFIRIISLHLKAQMLGFNMLTTKKAEVVIKQGRVKTTTFLAIDFMQKTAIGLGLSMLATRTTRSRAYHFFSVFLFFLFKLYFTFYFIC
ncbi:hypothetical protein PRUPE_1G183000 [Prunus persica]|uniref:Uncharacterized protein n=1 Tax=Prunus persica TaxID=3760 RepID=A0A251QZH7_PRUPE|nr:hypothetical protein PRUPE_1G183000 [Prunus persica]